MLDIRVELWSFQSDFSLFYCVYVEDEYEAIIQTFQISNI